GLVVLEALGLIDHWRRDPANAGYPWRFGDPQTLHVMMDAIRLAHADRDYWMCDPDFSSVPTAELLSDGYLEARSKLIKPGASCRRATPRDSRFAEPGRPTRVRDAARCSDRRRGVARFAHDALLDHRPVG